MSPDRREPLHLDVSWYDTWLVAHWHCVHTCDTADSAVLSEPEDQVIAIVRCMGQVDKCPVVCSHIYMSLVRRVLRTTSMHMSRQTS